jgi:hypothetical protein
MATSIVLAGAGLAISFLSMLVAAKAARRSVRRDIVHRLIQRTAPRIGALTAIQHIRSMRRR